MHLVGLDVGWEIQFMTYVISIVFLFFFIALVIYGAFKEMRNPVWQCLVKNFGVPSAHQFAGVECIQMFFFKNVIDKDFDYINSAKIFFSEQGVFIKPTINHFWLDSIFLPWSELEAVDRKRFFLSKRTVYRIRSAELLIAI